MTDIPLGRLDLITGRAGDISVTLTDLSNLYVNFTLPEQSRAQIAVGLAKHGMRARAGRPESSPR